MVKESVIEVLSDREHVLLRPQIYIGDTTTSNQRLWNIDKDTRKLSVFEIPFNEGFFKLFSEIIDNSIDEYIKTKGEFGDKIEVEVLDRNHVIVKDNGRGVPTTFHKQFKDKTSFEIAFTYLKAGSNFKKGTAESESDLNTGLNGVGVSLVNILSKNFKVTTEDKNNRYTLTCSDNMKNIECKKVKRQYKTGTSVEAEIDMSCFENSDTITKDIVKYWFYKRLVELHTFYPNIHFYFNGKEVNQTLYELIGKHTTAKDSKGNEITLVIKQYPYETDISYVNSLNTYYGGTHLQIAQDSVYSLLTKKINKKYSKEFKVDDIKKKFFLMFSLNNFPNPKFSTQNKTKLISSKSLVKEYIVETMFDKCVTNFISEFPSEIEDIADELDNNIFQKALKKEKKKINIAKFTDANAKDRSKTELFITEGLSASGHFLKCRDSKTQGCYPLRGKILNVYNESPKKVVESQELKQLMQVIGLEIGKKPIKEKLNFSMISILCDADEDGRDIESLLIVFFYKFFPELFKMNMICKIYAPLIIASKGNKKITYYTLEDYQKDSEKIGREGWKTEYFKGLGRMDDVQYKDMLQNPVRGLITFDNAEKISKTLELLFGKDTDNRKKWLQGELNIEQL